MKRNRVTIRIVAAVLLVSLGLLSFGVFVKPATDPQSYAHTIQAIDDKKATVMTLTAAAAAASTGLAAIPGDATSPIANQIMEISEYLFIVVCFLVLEKSLLTVMGYLGCKILIPLACLLLTLSLFWKKSNLRMLGLKTVIFAVLIVGIIPMSIRISDLIYDVNKSTVEDLNLSYQETLPVETAAEQEETVPQTEPVQTEQGWLGCLVSGFTDRVSEVKDQVSNVAENVTEQIGHGVSATVEEAKELLNRFVDAIALFVITYCAIPVIVVLVMVWVVKFLFQVQIPVPQKALKPFAKNKKIDAEETALVEM